MANYTGNSIVDYLKSVGQASDYASRATLAAQKGITNYTGSDEQNTKLLGMLNVSAPVVATNAQIQTGINQAQATFANIQQQAQPIIADKLGTPVAPIVVPPPIPKPDVAGATVAGATQTSKDIQSYLDLINTPKTPEQLQSDVLTARLNELLPQTAGKAQALATEETNLGLPEKKNQLAGINSQILTRTAEYNVLSKANEGKPITMNSIIGNERQILNAKGADIGLLQAQALGLQGQIDASKTAAAQAVDLKYATVQDEINIKLQQLKLIEPTLTTQEKKQSDALTYALNQQKNDLAVKVANEKDKNSTLLNLIQSYPDAGINLSTDTIETANEKITKNSKIYAEKIRPPASTVEDTTKLLDVLDVGRYNELYPEAGVVVGDSTATANAKVATTNTPEAKTRSLIQTAKDNNNSYETVVNEINNDKTITDKTTALKIAQEVYGTTTQPKTPGIFEIGGLVDNIHNFLFGK